jgi:hypothetical protein
MLLSLAALMLALTTGYYLVKRADRPSRSDKFGIDAENAHSADDQAALAQQKHPGTDAER